MKSPKGIFKTDIQGWVKAYQTDAVSYIAFKLSSVNVILANQLREYRPAFFPIIFWAKTHVKIDTVDKTTYSLSLST